MEKQKSEFHPDITRQETQAVEVMLRHGSVVPRTTPVETFHVHQREKEQLHVGATRV
jgi:hypothetical protein